MQRLLLFESLFNITNLSHESLSKTTGLLDNGQNVSTAQNSAYVISTHGLISPYVLEPSETKSAKF